MKINTRISGKTVVIETPPGAFAPWDKLYDGWLALANCRSVQGPLVNGVYAVEFEDSPLSDQELVEECIRVFRLFVEC